VPRGTVAQAAHSLGRQTGVSIAIRNAGAARRPAPALRGRMSATQALARLARASGLRVQAVGPRSFVLSAAPPRPIEVRAPSPPRPLRPRAVASPPVVDTPQPEIIVTATKRDTAIRDFAGQWGRIEGKDLDGWGPLGSDAIEARMVGFSSTHLGAGRNKLFIRGIGDSSFSGPTQSPVGEYVGDLRAGYSGPDPDLRLVDMDSIEVLEGPQGTLYGAGSLGGIVLLRPRPPEAGALGGEIALGASTTQHGAAGNDVSVVFNAPLGGEAAVRALAYRVVEGGYIDNLATGEKDANRVVTGGVRAAVKAPLGPDWTVEISGIDQRIRGDDSQYADRDGPRLSRDSATDLRFASDFALASLVVDKPVGTIRVRSTTGGTWQRVRELYDASLTDHPRRLAQASEASSVSNETRAWRPMRHGYSWLVGFSSLLHRYEVGRKLLAEDLQTDLAGVTNRVRETTLYGEVGVELRPALVATFGGRVSSSTLSGWGRHLNPMFADSRAKAEASRTETRILPSASLLARPSERLTLYARYQEGFRPGGLALADDMVRRYRNDHVATVETGFRLRALRSDALELRGSVTHSDWKNIQADYIDERGLPSTANIGDGRVWTATVNASARIFPALVVEAGLAWNDGQITNPSHGFAALAARRAGAMRIPNISRIVARAGATWSHDFGEDLLFKGNGYVRYVGKSHLGIGPRLGQSQGDYLDSGLSLRLGNRRRAISLTATNLTDAVGNRFALGTPVAVEHDQITPLRPRSIRLGLEAKF
jgi:outer membrane receptor protein involved in Fe transport